MSEALCFDHVTLWRRTQEELTYDLKRLILQVLERRYRPPSRRRTIDDVSFVIRRGEKFGIIGANGSGKSTLLKLACGVLRPTSGTVSRNGTIAALIELGAGFDGELTVTENVIYYGVLLGFDHDEIRRRVPAILDFAELRDYAHMPLKALSSGMSARLSFAVATEVRPDILLIDEVLAVGDEAFREKSIERMQRFWDAHSTIVMVSHDLQAVANYCDRALWIDSGRIRSVGPVRDVVHAYIHQVQIAAMQARRLAPDVPVASEAARGYIDRVVTHGANLAVDGWALLCDGSRGARVSIFVDGKHLVDAAYNVAREDVAMDYPGAEASHCGFTTLCPTESLTPGDHRIDCALFDDRDSRYHLIGESRTVTVASSLVDIAYRP